MVNTAPPALREPGGLLRRPSIGRYEWINDQLKEKPIGAEVDEINCILNNLSATFVRQHRLASVAA
jgi:hypothetical protein